MAGIVELTDTNFKEETAKGLTLIDFWAPWCGPCIMQHPILEKLAENVDENVKIAQVNVDDCPKAATSFTVQSIPTLVIMKDGQEVSRRIGLSREQDLLEEIDKNK